MAMQGKDKHLRRLKRLRGPDLRKTVGRVLYVASDMIRAKSYQEISRGSVSGKNHVPSKPGEYPNRDTGDLQGGLENRLISPTEAEVSSNAPHARPLEWGTSRMEPRPHIRPARDSEKPKIDRLLAQEMGGLVKRSGR